MWPLHHIPYLLSPKSILTIHSSLPRPYHPSSPPYPPSLSTTTTTNNNSQSFSLLRTTSYSSIVNLNSLLNDMQEEHGVISSMIWISNSSLRTRHATTMPWDVKACHSHAKVMHAMGNQGLPRHATVISWARVCRGMPRLWYG
jgi:hypothetical protein